MRFVLLKKRAAILSLLALMHLVTHSLAAQGFKLDQPLPIAREESVVGGSFRIIPLHDYSEAFCARSTWSGHIFWYGTYINIGGRADGLPWMLSYDVKRNRFLEAYWGPSFGDASPGKINGINRHGAGYITDSRGLDHAAQFWPGYHRLVNFPPELGEISSSHITDLNRRNSASGWYYLPGSRLTKAFFMNQEGEISELRVPEGAGDRVATGLDEPSSGSSTAVGWYQRPGTGPPYDRNACYWPAFTAIPLPQVQFLLDSVAIDIDGDIVVGHSSRPHTTYWPTYWKLPSGIRFIPLGPGVAMSCAGRRFIVGHSNMGAFLHHVDRDETWSLNTLCAELGINLDDWHLVTANAVTIDYDTRVNRRLNLHIVGAATRGIQRKAYLLTLQWDTPLVPIVPGGVIRPEPLPPPREVPIP